MAGMLQIITYMLAFYLVIKGCEVLMTALAFNREDRSNLIAFGVLVLGVCVVAAILFVSWQDSHTTSTFSDLRRW